MIWQAEREETLMAGSNRIYDSFGFVTVKFSVQADNAEDIALLEEAVKSCIDRIRLTLDVIEAKRKPKSDEAAN